MYHVPCTYGYAIAYIVIYNYVAYHTEGSIHFLKYTSIHFML